MTVLLSVADETENAKSQGIALHDRKWVPGSSPGTTVVCGALA